MQTGQDSYAASPAPRKRTLSVRKLSFAVAIFKMVLTRGQARQQGVAAMYPPMPPPKRKPRGARPQRARRPSPPVGPQPQLSGSVSPSIAGPGSVSLGIAGPGSVSPPIAGPGNLHRAPRIHLLDILGTVNPIKPIVRGVVNPLNAPDFANLLEAFPQLKAGAALPTYPKPYGRCMDNPPLPTRASVRHNNASQIMRSFPAPQYGPSNRCSVPMDAQNTWKRCPGRVFGLENHDDNFFFCDECANKSFETYNLNYNSLCYEMCYPCSLEWRENNPQPLYCYCRSMGINDAGGHARLCHACSRDIHELLTEEDVGKLAGKMPDHYNYVGRDIYNPYDQSQLVKYIDKFDQGGESGCTCNRIPMQKYLSYPELSYPSAQPHLLVKDFAMLVRVCLRCEKERFQTMDCIWKDR